MRLILVLISSLFIISCGKHTQSSQSSNGITNITEIKAEILSEYILNEDLESLNKYLLNNGDVDAELQSGRTLLTEACYWNKLKVIEFLVVNKAQLDKADRVGKTALQYAEENIKIKRILNPGLVIAQKVTLIELIKNNKLNELKKALEEIPQVNFFVASNELKIETGENEGETLLTLCLKLKFENAVRLLANPKLELDPNMQNKMGESPLSLSKKLTLKNSEKILIKIGAKNE